MTTSDHSAGPTSQAMYDASRKRRLSHRRKRKTADEVTYLNITPMLDMMTILLVFLIKSFATSAQDVNVANLTLPHSSTRLDVEEALQLMVTEREILLDQKVIAKLDDAGQIRLEDLPEGPSGYLVKPLYDALAHRAEYYRRIEEFGGAQFVGRIAIICDRTIHYRTLFKILYTTGQAEFATFKLFVQKPRA